MDSAIRITQLSFRYFSAGPEIFRDFSLDIPRGSCCAILGPTGAGKSSLLEIISGVTGSQCRTAVAVGAMQIAGESFTPIPTATLFPRVGLVLADPDVQISGLRDTVRSEVAFTLDLLGVPAHEQIPMVAQSLKTLDLEHLEDRSPSELSGGERQRVALGSILVARPPVLLLDEPANALDTRVLQRLKAFLRSLRGNSTVLFTDTGIDFALGLADLFVVLDSGRVIFSGSQSEFLRSLHRFAGILPVEQWVPLLNATPLPRPLERFL